MVEYALIVGLIAIVVITVVNLVGRSASNALCNVNGALQGKVGGVAVAWGEDAYGELGNGTADWSAHALPANVPTGSACIMGVGVGQYHTLALTATGSVLAWGYNATGQLGYSANAGTSNANPNPAFVQGLPSAVAISGGFNSSYAIGSDGTVWSWGDNSHGELGMGSVDTNVNITPHHVLAGACACGGSTYLNGITQIAASKYYALALRNDGSVWGWGYDTNGQLGNGANSDVSQPVQVSGLAGVTDIAVANWSAAAVKNDGSVWTWGLGAEAQLGNGGYSSSNTPVQVVSGACGSCVGGYLTGVTQISMSQFDVYALRSDGTVWSWGDNAEAELGLASTGGGASSPVAVVAGGCGGCGSSLSGVSSIGGSGYGGLAVRKDGTVYSWGENAFGEHGNNTSCGSYPCTDVLGPVLVSKISSKNKAMSVDSSNGYTIVVIVNNPV